VTTPVPQPSLFPAEVFRTEVLLVRHGRSADVVPGSGASLDPPLHDLGVAQAAALASRLGGRPLDGIYASDLARARQTAAPLAEERGMRVELRPALREVHLGDWEGGEFRRRAAARDPEWLTFAEAGRWELIPGAERDDEFRGRVRAAVAEVVERHQGGSAAVVCHAGVVNAFLADVLGIHRTTFTVIENTSVTVVRFADDGRCIVLAVNDCNHLYDPARGLPR
jgi:2,3-bisphosphoglycerate-dependent phosphoglycerate mutase